MRWSNLTQVTQPVRGSSNASLPTLLDRVLVRGSLGSAGTLAWVPLPGCPSENGLGVSEVEGVRHAQSGRSKNVPVWI